MSASPPPPTLAPLPALLREPALRTALAEDLGLGGDLTTQGTIPEETRARALLRTRHTGRIAGLDMARDAFLLLDPHLHCVQHGQDGQDAPAGTVLLEIEGRARAILSAERVALNFLGHLSGIATATQKIVQAVTGTKARIACTRKTTPGLRALEKYAVRAGGGVNHRFRLDDGVLIKDNHIAAAGGIAQALARIRASVGHMVPVEIEVDTLPQLEEALSAGAGAVLLDNMSPGMLAEAVTLTNGRALLEASGNINARTARPVAESGVDLISVGWITHSAPCLDVGLDFDAESTGDAEDTADAALRP